MQSTSLRRRLAAVASFLAVLFVLGPAPAGAVNTLFLHDSALSALSEADMGLLLDAIDRGLAAPEGESVSWENPKTGAKGTVEPGTFYERDGRSCRHLKLEFSTKTQRGAGQWSYCRRADGPWELMPP